MTDQEYASLKKQYIDWHYDIAVRNGMNRDDAISFSNTMWGLAISNGLNKLY